MPVLTQDKNSIIARAKEIYASRYSKDIPDKGGCLMWSAAFCEASRENGGKSVIVAGSASFQFRADDGKSATHWSYMFDLREATPRFVLGLLPEMHVWSITEAIELVDLTTGFQPQQAESIGHYEWDKDLLPPPYLWCPVKEVPKQFLYTPNKVATKMAAIFISEYHNHQKELLQRRSLSGI